MLKGVKQLTRSKKAQSETHWAWAMIVVTIIVAGGMMAYVVRSSSGAEVVQEYVSNNFASLFNTIISSPGIVVYKFNTSISGYDFKISISNSHTEIASKIKSLSGEDSYSQPSIKLHTFPQDYELIGENTYTEPFYIIKSGKNIYLQKDSQNNSSTDIIDIECLSYMNYKYPKSQSDTSLLLLSSSQSTINNLNKIAQNLGTKTTVTELNEAYSGIIKNKDGTSKFDIVLIIEESSNKNSIIIANPLLSSKRLGCTLGKEIREIGEIGKGVDIEQSKLDVDVDYEILSLLNLKELNEEAENALIRAINTFFDTGKSNGVEA